MSIDPAFAALIRAILDGKEAALERTGFRVTAKMKRIVKEARELAERSGKPIEEEAWAIFRHKGLN
jgi:hypothetical protein